MDRVNPAKVVFVAGASRSGSTLLEDQLALASGGTNVGEMRRINDFFLENWEKITDPSGRHGCACGQPVRDCSFWNEVAAHAGITFGKDRFSSQGGWIVRTTFKLSALLLGARVTRSVAKIWGPFRQELESAENCFALYDAIAELTGGTCVVDASKQIHQYLMLRVARPDAMCLIVLVRDARAVSLSMIRGSRRNGFVHHIEKRKKTGGVTEPDLVRAAALAWWRAMSNVFLTGLLTPRRRKAFIRYEDFCDHPQQETRRLLTHFDIPAEGSREDIVTHAIGGSPSRRSADFRTIRRDDSWRKQWFDRPRFVLPWRVSLLNRLAGYRDDDA